MTDGQLNTRRDSKGPSRMEKTNNIVDEEVRKMLKDLDIVASDLDAIMEILKDRLIQSTDASFPIALARLGEVRMDTIKKRIDIIKTLVNDKSIEANVRKKSSGTDLEAILSGVGLGAALGVTVTTQNSINQKKKEAELSFTTIDADHEQLEFETEHLNTRNDLQQSSIDALLDGHE